MICPKCGYKILLKNKHGEECYLTLRDIASKFGTKVENIRIMQMPSQQSATLRAKHGEDYFKQLALRSVATKKFKKLLDKSA
jgi:hypothetical protein